MPIDGGGFGWPAAGPPWRGVAPAASVPAVVISCTLDDGAGEARAVRPAPARHGPEATSHEAIERHPAKAR
jgi:hypothetical protein